MFLSCRRIFIAQYKVDMRKSFDGLYVEARRHGVKLLEGEAMVFVGGNKRIIKAICADTTGLIIVAKRFSKQCMKTRLAFLSDPSVLVITRAELEMLFEGKDYEVKRQPLAWLPVGRERDLQTGKNA
jgi:transposase